jgi:hypothetical protein
VVSEQVFDVTKAEREPEIEPDRLVNELRAKVGDGVSQAADLIFAASSIPSLNFTPSMTFGNWF